MDKNPKNQSENVKDINQNNENKLFSFQSQSKSPFTSIFNFSGFQNSRQANKKFQLKKDSEKESFVFPSSKYQIKQEQQSTLFGKKFPSLFNKNQSKIESHKQQRKPLDIFYSDVNKDFQDFKKQTTQKLKYIDELKGQIKHINQQLKNKQSAQRIKSQQLHKIIQNLKLECVKKDNDIQRLFKIMQKQLQIIQNQSMKINSFQKQINTGFNKVCVELENIKKQQTVKKQSYVSYNPFIKRQRQENPFPQRQAINSFRKKCNNPFAQKQQKQQLINSIQNNDNKSEGSKYKIKNLFDRKKINKNQQFPLITKKNNGYTVKYRQIKSSSQQERYRDVQISNQYGKIQINQQITSEYFNPDNQNITDYIIITQFGCQIIDDRWQSISAKLTSYNFMNFLQMKQEQKYQIQKQIQDKGKATGLRTKLEWQTGNLIMYQ